MDIKEVKELIEMINSSSLSYFEFKTDDGHLKMDKSINRDISTPEASMRKDRVSNFDNIKESIKSTDDSIDRPSLEIDEDDKLSVITSPMVGTFYGSPSPESHAFAKEGDLINKGDTLCIIEAMKLMNEIESEVSGIVKKVLVKEGDMVEYGQPLFKVKEN